LWRREGERCERGSLCQFARRYGAEGWSNRERLMSIEQSVEILRELVSVSLLVSGPILAVSVTVGVAVSLVQAVTSIQESSMSFIPKVTSMGVVLVVLSPWMLKTLMTFTASYLSRLPEAIR
jgi:flagellar biosynthetic protein FliQ